HSVLLAFLGARVARHEPGLAQARPQLGVVYDERPRDPETNRAGLSRDAPARGGRDDIEPLDGLGQDERLPDHQAMQLAGEGRLDWLVVDSDDPFAGSEKYA